MLSLPKNFETFNDARKKSFMALYEAKEYGKKVIGTFCSYTPLEIINAAGAISVGLCGKSEQGIAEAETVLPKTLCPLIKASYGMAFTDQCPYFYFSDAIIAETTCDGKKKMYELMNKITPVHALNLPQSRSQAFALEMWTEVAKLKPSPVSGYEISTVAESADFHFTDDYLIAKIENTAQDFRSRVRNDGADRPRVLITGCPNA